MKDNFWYFTNQGKTVRDYILGIEELVNNYDETIFTPRHFLYEFELELNSPMKGSLDSMLWFVQNGLIL